MPVSRDKLHVRSRREGKTSHPRIPAIADIDDVQPMADDAT
jgi:hypothetical protein